MYMTEVVLTFKWVGSSRSTYWNQFPSSFSFRPCIHPSLIMYQTHCHEIIACHQTGFTEAPVGRCSSKQVFLKKAWRPPNLLERDSNTVVFICILRIFWEVIFCRTCFYLPFSLKKNLPVISVVSGKWHCQSWF